MTQNCMSVAASGLFSCLIARSGADRSKVRLRNLNSEPWQSLTFSGERHRLSLTLPADAVGPLCDGLGDAEFDIPDNIVVDIHEISRKPEGSDSSTVEIEALTIDDQGTSHG